MRGRYKKRGLNGNGKKLDQQTPSLDMCTCCLSFHCDPATMSEKFRHKVSERRRKGLCPSCGNPKAHCKCKSSSKLAPHTSVIRTHNNKKRRKVLARITVVEAALQMWEKTEEQRLAAMGEGFEALDYDIWYALRNHKPMTISWNDILEIAKKSGLGQEFLDVLYPVWH